MNNKEMEMNKSNSHGGVKIVYKDLTKEEERKMAEDFKKHLYPMFKKLAKS